MTLSVVVLTAWSHLGTINQHDHVLRRNAWTGFSFRHETGWSWCLWAGHFTQNCPILIICMLLLVVAIKSLGPMNMTVSTV